MKRRLLNFLLVVCMGTTVLAGCNNNEMAKTDNAKLSYYLSYKSVENVIDVDFGKRDGTGVQNVKKYDMFTPTWTMVSGDTANYGAIDQFKSIDPMKAEAYRVDLMLGMGGMGNFVANSDELSGKTQQEWAITDAVVDGLTNNNVIPYLVFVGIPTYAQTNNGGWRNMPDMVKYQEFIKNAATYITARGKRVIYETWNEPDLGGQGTFWLDGMESMVDVNIAQAQAIKSVNPDAEVAELGLCWPVTFIEDGSWDYYMQQVKEKNHTVDAFSWHFYALHGGRFENEGTYTHRDGGWNLWKQKIREAIAEGQVINPSMETMQQHLTEFSPADANDELIDQVGIVPSFYEAIKLGNEATDISRISWNSYLTDAYGMIHPYSYQRRPVYYTLWTYGRLPVAKASVSMNQNLESDFGYMSGVDSKRAGIVVYNKNKLDSYGERYLDQLKKADDDNTKSVTVKMKNIPFDAEKVSIYLIDNSHESYSSVQDKPYLVYERAALAESLNNNGEAEITLNIPGNASMYIEINDKSESYELDDEIDKLADKIVRKDYHYAERGDNLPYGFMHERSMNAYVSMADSNKGSGTMCVTLDDMKAEKTLNVGFDVFGDVNNEDKDAAIGFRIDYRTRSGSYKNSTFYHLRNYRNQLAVKSFGTGIAAENLTSIGESLSGSYILELEKNAPADWDGRIQITYQINNAGKGVTANFKIF